MTSKGAQAGSLLLSTIPGWCHPCRSD